MSKYVFVGVVSLVLTGGLYAAEVKGKVKSADAGKSVIVLTVGDKDQTIAVGKTAEVYTLGKAKKGQTPPRESVPGGLGGLKEGTEVTVTTETTAGKEVATEIKVEGADKKKKKADK